MSTPSVKKRPIKKKTPDPIVVAWPKKQPTAVRRQLLAWHKVHGRSQLPWAAVPNDMGVVNDYHIAVSEVMMQQTTVAVGLKRFPLWIATFPTWESLAEASSESVMKAWEGLGYYARARSLHKMAQAIVNVHHSRMPHQRELRLELPGVGPTTASALGAFVHGCKEPIWDANVNRIWKRWWGDLYPSMPPSAQKKWEWDMAQQAMPSAASEIRSWTQAVMDLGATVCTPKSPRCSECPWISSCRSYALGIQNENPSKKPVLVRQDMWKNWVWISDGDMVAVAPPNPKGIWSGLWQLPELEIYPLLRNPMLTTGNHKLSHRDVAWSVLKISKEQLLLLESGSDFLSQCVWKSHAQWQQLALPQPLRKWWDGLSADQQKKWTS